MKKKEKRDTEVTDGNGDRTSYEVDTWGKVTKIEKADGSSESYRYEEAENLIYSRDREGKSYKYTKESLRKNAARVLL